MRRRPSGTALPMNFTEQGSMTDYDSPSEVQAAFQHGQVLDVLNQTPRSTQEKTASKPERIHVFASHRGKKRESTCDREKECPHSTAVLPAKDDEVIDLARGRDLRHLAKYLTSAYTHVQIQ